MDLDDLRLIILDERASGKLAEINSETFRETAEYLHDLYSEAKSIDHFMTRRGSELIDEIESVRSTLQDITTLRFNKIIKLALVTVQGGKTDKEELKRMLPEERLMFEKILTSVGECRNRLTGPELDGSSFPADFEVPEDLGIPETEIPADLEPVHEEEQAGPDEVLEYEPVCLLEDIDSFMGIDGRIYTLSKEDIVMLPKKNASVLYSRNIALNIRVGK